LFHAAFELGDDAAVLFPLLLGLRVDADFRLGVLGAATGDHFRLPVRVVAADSFEQLPGFFQLFRGRDEVTAGFELFGGAGQEVALEIDVGRVELRRRDRRRSLCESRNRRERKQGGACQSCGGKAQGFCDPIKHWAGNLGRSGRGIKRDSGCQVPRFPRDFQQTPARFSRAVSLSLR
jgi:hypothetical protein